MPLVICMAYDYKAKRRVHPIFLTGAVIMAIALLRLPLGTTDFGQGLGVLLFESLTTRPIVRAAPVSRRTRSFEIGKKVGGIGVAYRCFTPDAGVELG